MNTNSYQSVRNTNNLSKCKKIFMENDFHKSLNLPVNPEKAADILLMLSNEFRSGCKKDIYTQKQIERKIRLDNTNLLDFDHCKIPKETEDYLFESALNECIELAKLTSAQEVIFKLFAYGLDCRKIGDILHIRHQSVWKHIKTAKIKLARVWKDGQYAGWHEVYLSEVNRYSKEKASR